MLASVIQDGVSKGMCAMDDSLAAPVAKGTITAAAAMAKAKDKARFTGSSRGV